MQGLGGAVVSAVALSLIMTLFTEPAERTKAMGVFGFVMAGGGSIGVLLGGVLTDTLSWHWIFLVNVPIGIPVDVLTLRLIPASAAPERAADSTSRAPSRHRGADARGLRDRERERATAGSPRRRSACSAPPPCCSPRFFVIESRVATPLVPFAVVKLRNVWASNVVGLLWAAAMFAGFFISALYLQRVLGYSPLAGRPRVPPGNVIMGVFSLGLSAKLVMRFGIKPPLVVGLGLAAAGLAPASRARRSTATSGRHPPSMILIGFGAGMAFNPVLLAAMSGVSPSESGLASGIVNTAFMMGGALGLAVLASLADWRTDDLRDSGRASSPR